MTSVLILIPQSWLTPNLTDLWLMTWDHHPKNQITINKKCFPFLYFFLHSNVPVFNLV